MNTSILTGRRRNLAALVIAVAVAASIAAAAVASAERRPHAPKAQKPTIVLVHGGWADSSGWNAQVTKLQRLGYPVIAPANPLRGLSSDADYIRSVLVTIKTPIVLVGHSYGGAVISNAAVGVPNVKALVYIAAFAPDKGESLLQLVTMNPGSEIGPTTLITRKYPTANGGEGTDLYLTQHGFRTAFAGDVPTRLADQMWADAAPLLGGGLRVAIRRTRLEDDPVLVPRLDPGSSDPAGHAAVHGQPGEGDDHPGKGITRPDDLEASLDDQPHPQGCQVGGVSQVTQRYLVGRTPTSCRPTALSPSVPLKHDTQTVEAEPEES